MKQKLKWMLIISICGGIIVALTSLKSRESVENLDVEMVTGIDISTGESNAIEYRTIRETVVFSQEGKRISKITEARGYSSGGTREIRQLKSSKEKIIGLVKVDLLSERYARHGIITAIDIHFNDPNVNDTAKFAVCKGDLKSTMEYKTVGYTSFGDFVDGLITSHKGSDFFPDEYSAKNMYVRMDSEGRNIQMPYIELTEEGIQLTGLALFNKDKMIAVVDIKNARIMNMLHYNNVKGIVSIYNDKNGYIDFEAIANRKIKCNKVGDKYNFIINLKLKGDIISNTYYNRGIDSVSEERTFEKLMAENITKQCNEFINTMKSKYKVDCLELGRVAAATYGRRKGIDWNEAVMNSNIEFNVKVELDKQGRGKY